MSQVNFRGLLLNERNGYFSAVICQEGMIAVIADTRMARLFSCLYALISCALLFAQSATNAPPAARVHISGTAKQCGKPVLRKWWVSFDGNPPLAAKMVKTDDSGVYGTDLPFGVWTMTLRIGADDTTEFVRPRHFQVSASGSLVLDSHLRPPIACSVRGTPEQRARACWGEQFFQVPTATGVPLEVDVFGSFQYGNPCGAIEKGRHREFATYNLLSIEADRVAYHPSEKILEASGDVLLQDESGEHKADSIRLYLEDGRVSALPDHR